MGRKHGGGPLRKHQQKHTHRQQGEPVGNDTPASWISWEQRRCLEIIRQESLALSPAWDRGGRDNIKVSPDSGAVPTRSNRGKKVRGRSLY